MTGTGRGAMEFKRSNHPEFVKRISINALKTVRRLRRFGYQAYVIGGCVRDLLLGREPKDFDVATDATPRKIKRCFNNCFLIGRRFRLAHLHFPDEIIEVATFRTATEAEEETQETAAGERAGSAEDPAAETVAQIPEQPAGGASVRVIKSEAGMLLRDNVYGTLEDDILRRDFTVNALCYDPDSGDVLDLIGGMEDLRNGIIRTIGDPVVRFTEDPVRMLRAVRFAASLSFELEAGTRQAIEALHGHIRNASPSRLFDEMPKTLLKGYGAHTYSLLRATGLFDDLFPELAGWLDRESEGFPHTTVSAVFAWADEKARSGEAVSVEMFYTLLFGPLIEEQALVLQETTKLPPQETAYAAVEAFFSRLGETVRFTGKVRTAVGNVLACQYRFAKIPAKRAQAFVQRPVFDDALEYFRFTRNLKGEGADIHAWWKALAEGRQTPVPPPVAAGTVKKRRRRRRGGRSGRKDMPEI